MASNSRGREQGKGGSSQLPLAAPPRRPLKRDMRRELRCIFPNVYKIPADCINKSIFKSCLEEAPQKLLRQVAESKVAYLSPFDSAAILNKLIENTNDKGISELRRDPLYRPAASKLVGSIERYRQELLFYFMLKFYKLHDICAIKSITRVFVERQATRIQNINQLVDLLYHLAHHIPKEIRSDDTVKDQPEYYQEWQEGSNEDHVHVCRTFIRDIQRELVGKIQELRDSTLIYKLIVSLNKLPKTEYTRGILKGVQEKGK